MSDADECNHQQLPAQVIDVAPTQTISNLLPIAS